MKQQVWDVLQSIRQKCEEVVRERTAGDRIFIQVGSATCENAAGAVVVAEEFRKHIAASGRDDIVLRRTGCTGRCSREPIVSVYRAGSMPVKYQQVTRDLVHKIFTQHVLKGEPLLDHVLDGPIDAVSRFEILNCASLRCGWKGEKICGGPMANQLRAMGVEPEECRVINASCFGACSAEEAGKRTHILVRPQNVLYRIETLADLEEVVREHIRGGRIVERLRVRDEPVSQDFFELYGEVAFFNRQTRIALRHNGIIDPESIEEYVHYRGFEALAKVLSQGDPQSVIDEVIKSKLRGRGGGGFATGEKWALATKSPEKVRYIICNADEGDPGAFMDRSMLESDPFNVIEGMIIGAFAIGAHQGFVYVRAEYPLAVERIDRAIRKCREWGLLGKNILNSGFDFDLSIRLGAGAFVCGEETALIHSIEGERGQPRIRPPYPTEVGLWGKPTVINNVETFANVPAVIIYGADWFSRIGSQASGGTKVFALAGKINHTGLVEVPIGITLREIVMEIGGGCSGGTAVKAVQTGGPAGGCIPATMLDLRVDFDTLNRAGSIMGSGGMIVLDEDDCMVDIAKFFTAFSEDESCGKCTPCREGTKRMMEILDRITNGKADESDLDKLERLAKLVRRSSLCGLGRAAPNPVLSTLTHFRDEYLAHVRDKRCPAKKCTALIRFEIDAEKCVGCTACARNCPVECISGNRREVHVIDQARCIKCGRCFQVCRFDAVLKL
ncbi:NADH-quinone oxidoreductase subunit NuoF [Thermopirellula anaerolimosa]